jgi:L-fuconolactonase
MIDAHHHLWKYSAEDYPWIPPDSALARDQLVSELEAVTDAAGVRGTIAVQARQMAGESDFLLDLADACPRIRGVIGWVPLVDQAVGRDLERFGNNPKFRGVRHVLQDEPDSYFQRDDFHRGLAMLPSRGLVYELLIYQRQLPAAIRLVDRQPDLGIVIDHLAKPQARDGEINPEWRSWMCELAKRPNILGVKFSGLATEFPAGGGKASTIAAYFHETLAIFGADRVMFGSDWPVCLLRIEYQRWTDMVKDLADCLTAPERQAILENNALRIYGLPEG